MALNQAAFNATVIAVQNNESNFTNLMDATYSISNGQLNLESQSITSEDAQSLVIALKNNTTLNYINLNNNSIGDSGAQALATALQTNTSLTALNLYSNQISDIGTQYLITALLTNYSLTYLELAGNSISPNNLLQINTLISRNQQSLQFGPVRSSSNYNIIIRSGANTIKISQGGTINLTPDNLKASSINNATIIIYTFTDVINGDIFKTDTGASIRQCSDADIQAGLVSASQSGSSKSLEYSVAATNGTVTTPPHKAAVIFTLQSNPPILINNNFTLVQNSITPITTNNFLASFTNLTVPALPGLIFNVFNVTGGRFQEVNQTTPLLTFTQGAVINNQIEFACAPGQYPSCELQAGDGEHNSTIIPAVFNLLPCAALQQAITDLNNNAITALDLTGQNIGDWGAQLLAIALAKNTSLALLILASNQISDSGAEAIFNSLTVNKSSLTYLNLIGNPLTDICIQAATNMLTINTSLASLALYGNQMSDIGIQLLLTAAEKNTSLNTFSIGGSNKITNASTQIIADFLNTNTTLKTFAVVSTQIDDIGAQIIALALKNSTLTYFNFSGNTITDIGAQAFITALQNNYFLITFLLDGTVSAENLTAISLLMARNTAVTQAITRLKDNDPTLTSLDLSNMHINDVGATLIAEALKGNTSLEYLNLNTNQIGDIGTTALANTLKTNNTLKILYLDINQITSTGVIALANALQENSSLTYLDLGDNDAGNMGANALAETLKINTSLNTLELGANNINDIGFSNLIDALNNNASIKILYFYNNEIDNAGAKLLITTLQNNYSIIYCDLSNNSISQANLNQINALLIRNQNTPSFTTNKIAIKEGQTLVLSSENIAATTPTGSITYMISAVEHGRFINANNQTITTFTQTEIDDGAIRFEAFDFNRIPASYNITATNGNFTTPVHIGSVDFIPVNHAPLLINHIANQTITVDDPFEFHIPKNTFEDLDNDTLRLSVTEANGTPLPPNLQFNQSSNTLSGSFNHTGTQTLLVTAKDTYNLSTSDEFSLMIAPKENSVSSSSSSSAGIIAGVVAGIGAIAAGGFLLWRKLRSPKSAVQPGIVEENTIPMTNMVELERFYSVAAAGDTELQTDKDGYERPKPLYEVNWPNESDTDPSSTQNYELMQKRRTEYGIPMNSGKNQRHNAQIFQPSAGLASYEDIKTTTNEPDKKQPYELLEPGSQAHLKPNDDTHGFSV